MNSRPLLPRLFLLVFALWLAAAGASRADEVDGPATLVISVRAQPGWRSALRTAMEGEGAAQLAAWRREGVFREARILFGALAGEAPVDMLVLLDFDHFSDIARWKAIDRRRPGGLPETMARRAQVESTVVADPLARHATAPPDAAKSASLVAFYEVLTDEPRYRSYVAGYTVPQLEGWMQAGVLGGYRMVLNQNSVGARWNAMLLLDYVDMPALARRDEVKNAVRKSLAETNPAWKTWSTDKGAIRKEKSLSMFDTIALP